MKRILALIMSVALVLGVVAMAGCGDNGTTETTTTSTTKANETTTAKEGGNTETTGSQSGTTETTTANTQPGETTAATEETTTADVGGTETDGDYDYFAKLPGKEDIDFGGRVFLIATYEGVDERWDNFREVYSDETDAISTSVRYRNQVVETLYNCKINIHMSTEPNTDAANEVTANQHTIDIFSQQYTNTGIATNDQQYNLYDYNIDFSQPWWDQQWTNTYTIKNAAGKNTLYAAVGDYAINSFAATAVMFYNKALYEQKLSDVNIYDLVRNNEWTVDKFTEILKRPGLANDVNGNSVYDYVNDGDILSWARVQQVAHGLHVASGLSILNNVDGAFVFEPAANTTSWVAIIDKAIDLYNLEGTETISYSYVQEAIEGNKALFASEVLDVLERMKDADISVGLIPYPLYSETQENYAHYVDNHFCTYSIPISVTDPENVANFFEVYTFHSKGIVREAFIETYCVEYCGDADSAEMLDIILDTRTYDPGYLWWSSYETDISNMILNGKNTITQWSGAKGTMLKKNIETFMTQLNDNKN